LMNGTTGQKQRREVELVLIQLQGRDAGKSRIPKAPRRGSSRFDHPGLGAQPMLVRAVYHGVNFKPRGSARHGAPRKWIFTNRQRDVKDDQRNFPRGDLSAERDDDDRRRKNIRSRTRRSLRWLSTKPRGSIFDFCVAGRRPAAAGGRQRRGPAGMPGGTSLPIDKKKNRYSIAFCVSAGRLVPCGFSLRACRTGGKRGDGKDPNNLSGRAVC